MTPTLPDPQEMAERILARKPLARRPRLLSGGALSGVTGLTVEAEGCALPLGARCRISAPGVTGCLAEVVGFRNGQTFLMPLQDLGALRPGARVAPAPEFGNVAVGASLLGRVVDALGRPLDGHGSPHFSHMTPLHGRPLNPLTRAPVDSPLDVGVRAINALLTVGRGQRLGLFAGSGVGKSVLLGMMTQFTEADVIVVGLIGERGREVADFVQRTLSSAARKRAVVVAAPADAPPLVRVQGALRATAYAEFFRDQGLHVLLLMDSLTRFAQAHREISLAIGEPPARQGYTPSVFARLPQLVERAGNSDSGAGSITAFYTVLTEGDDPNDPIADAARAILDGHILLSRSIAERGRYPAIDIEASVSRTMADVVDESAFTIARKAKAHLSRYNQAADLIAMGAYQAGSDPRLDEAIALNSPLEAFLTQGAKESASLHESLSGLRTILEDDA